MALESPPPLLEVAHVAHRLGYGQAFVRQLIAGGALPAIRLGRRWRIDPRDLEAFINARRRTPARRRDDASPLQQKHA